MSSKQLSKSQLDEDPSDSDSDSEYFSDEDEIASFANTVVSETKAEEKAKNKKILNKLKCNLKKRRDKRGNGCPLILGTGKRAGHACRRRLHRLRNGSKSTLCRYHHNRQTTELRIAAKYSNPNTLPPVLITKPNAKPRSTTNLAPPPPPISMADFFPPIDNIEEPIPPPNNIPPPTIPTTIPTAIAPAIAAPNNAGTIDAGGDTNMADANLGDLVKEYDELTAFMDRLSPTPEELERKRKQDADNEAKRIREEFAAKEAREMWEQEQRLLADIDAMNAKRLEALKTHR